MKTTDDKKEGKQTNATIEVGEALEVVEHVDTAGDHQQSTEATIVSMTVEVATSADPGNGCYSLFLLLITVNQWSCLRIRN